MTVNLLATKLYIPPTHPNIVPRTRLVERLNAGLSCKLTFISAPAGFGKSTLISSWIQQVEPHKRVAWLSLDEGDNDLNRFLTYFVAALQTIDSSIGQGLLVAFQSQEAVNVEIVLTTLLNEITEFPDDVVLVLDDYHVIESQPIDKAITFLLNHLPPQMHLVIASRIDPSLPLSRLRANRQMTELRAADLRFTVDEAFVFLNQIIGLDLSAQDVSALEMHTEGWIAGLQLAAISMKSLKGSSEIIDFFNNFASSNRYIQDYLADEVLRQRPKGTRDFLLQTSILNRLSAPLCDAVRFGIAESRSPKGTTNDSQVILESLEAANLFIIPLDNERRWYRYHHLFVDLLAHRLSRIFPDRVPELHQRASSWYENEGYTDDAVLHAQAAGDTDRTAFIIEDHWQEYVRRGELTRLMHLLDSLGPEVIKKSAPLSLAYGWIHHLKGAFDAIPGYISNIREILREGSVTEDVQQPTKLALIPSAVEILEAIISLENKHIERAKEHAKRAISLIPDYMNAANRRLVQGAAGFRLAQAHRELGEIDQACAAFLDVLEMLKAIEDYFGVANTVLQIVTLYQESGKTQEAIKLCEDTLVYIEEHHWEKMSASGMVNVILAGLQADTGDYIEARKNLEIGRELIEQILSQQIRNLVDRVDEKLGDITPSPQPLVEPLSQRELEVLQLIAKGLTNPEIASRLYLSLNTVKVHSRNIYGKLGVNNRTQAAAKAKNLGILSSN